MMIIGTLALLAVMTNLPFDNSLMLKSIEESWHRGLIGLTADGAQAHATRNIFVRARISLA